MGMFDDLSKKAKAALNDPKTRDALKSDKAEDVSDRILGGAAGVANKVTGGKHADKIDKARDAADRKVGNDDAPGSRTSRDGVDPGDHPAR